MATLEIQHDGLRLRKGTGEALWVPRALASRSALLTDLLACADNAGTSDHPEPVDEISFTLWVHQADQLMNSSAADISEELALDLVQHVGSLCSLIVASDVLVDEGTKAHAVGRLAKALSQPQALDRHLQQVEASLPEPLLLAVFSAIPLSHCLSHLPPSHHHSALLAHNPSMKSSHTLRLAPLPPHVLSTALRLLTATTTLVSLSLAGSSPHADPTLLSSTLRALRHLTALDLRDTALYHQPTATAVIDALPALPLLATLDLSDNLITPPAMKALKLTLMRRSALRALHMLRAFSIHSPGPTALRYLGVLCTLSGLTALSIGGRGGMTCKAMRAALTEPFVAMLRGGKLRLPNLQHLELRLFDADLTGDAVTCLWQFLGALPPLRHLGLDVPLLYCPPLCTRGSTIHPYEEHPRHTFVVTEYGLLSNHVSQQTQLTSLHLDITPLRHTRGPVTELHTAIGALSRLLQLQLKYSAMRIDRSHDDLAALAPVLPKLSHLSHLSIMAATRHGASCDLPKLPSLHRVVDAVATCMPHMRVLHLPVPANSSGDDRGLVQALLGITQLQKLTVDLFLHGNPEFKSDPSWVTATSPKAESPTVVLATFAPLLAKARTIDIDFDDHDESWLAPLGAAATELTQLHTLRICGGEARPVAGDGLGAVLENISALTCLHELDIRANISMDGGDACHGGDMQRRFHSGLRQLTALTSLRTSTVMTPDISDFEDSEGVKIEGFEMFRRQELFPQLLPHVACLRSLQHLRMYADAAADPAACVSALGPVALKTLLIDSSREMDALDSVLDVVKQLPELRVLTVLPGVCPKEMQAITAALRDVPWCRYEPFQEYMSQDKL